METHLSHSGPMNPLATRTASVEAWQALVAPGDVFRHPREVLTHPLLSRADKRTILASWASDACALENAPGLRCLSGCKAEPVSVDAVLAALTELDRGSARKPNTRPAAVAPARRPLRISDRRRYFRPGRRDDDDDPPPCPAAAMPRPRTPPSAAALALCVPA
ncbi:hypothetical protein MOX02_52060 [Methylobacterium oxalidis]|uniref:Uncharacterized protein n=1 Tax=Methylobacterium oxalidis TaxID=944322 RepID=A0A512JB23_9HYPH|nr:hypothetical protein [Methylobacterium oxalidis]GEP07168.1 hypothetical protein MOX02_52060 [Methylobacterium oxalidis]GLS64419.1 hypothetical protein GCM10007888_28000 [Methylobacterium oxalidis]